jgi:hypothetical protein
VVIKHDLYKNIGDIYVYIDFEMLKVKVPIIFFGTEGFSARRDGRYMIYSLGTVFKHYCLLCYGR